MDKVKKVLFAPKRFYQNALTIAVPIMVQNAMTNLVSMLDNIMVGRIGTDAMSGVSIINQLFFVYNLCVFGGLSGIGIFTAQFWGKKDMKGMRYTMRAKLLLTALLTVLCGAVLILFQNNLIGMFLHEGGSAGSLTETLAQARLYLKVICFSLPALALSNVYASTLRETGTTRVPMQSSLAAVVVNLTGNYFLIGGHFGFPALGVAGAALATVLSRYVEMVMNIMWLHSHVQDHPYIIHLVSGGIPSYLMVQFVQKGTPLLINETLWSMGQTMLAQSYSVRGLDAVAAMNICGTLSNVFNIVFLSMGSATAIILGQKLGRGELDDVKLEAYRLTVLSLLLSLMSGALLFVCAPVFPKLYNTTNDVRTIATGLLCVYAVCMPAFSFSNSNYFTIRAGGKTVITFVFDSLFVWMFYVPLAFVLSRYTNMPVVKMYFCVQALEIIKGLCSFVIVRKGSWIHDLTQYG